VTSVLGSQAWIAPRHAPHATDVRRSIEGQDLVPDGAQHLGRGQPRNASADNPDSHVPSIATNRQAHDGIEPPLTAKPLHKSSRRTRDPPSHH
jgi:hypothetical protein